MTTFEPIRTNNETPAMSAGVHTTELAIHDAEGATV